MSHSQSRSKSGGLEDRRSPGSSRQSGSYNARYSDYVGADLMSGDIAIEADGDFEGGAIDVDDEDLNAAFEAEHGGMFTVIDEVREETPGMRHTLRERDEEKKKFVIPKVKQHEYQYDKSCSSGDEGKREWRKNERENRSRDLGSGRRGMGGGDAARRERDGKDRDTRKRDSHNSQGERGKHYGELKKESQNGRSSDMTAVVEERQSLFESFAQEGLIADDKRGLSVKMEVTNDKQSPMKSSSQLPDEEESGLMIPLGRDSLVFVRDYHCWQVRVHPVWKTDMARADFAQLWSLADSSSVVWSTHKDFGGVAEFLLKNHNSIQKFMRKILWHKYTSEVLTVEVTERQKSNFSEQDASNAFDTIANKMTFQFNNARAKQLIKTFYPTPQGEVTDRSVYVNNINSGNAVDLLKAVFPCSSKISVARSTMETSSALVETSSVEETFNYLVVYDQININNCEVMLSSVQNDWKGAKAKFEKQGGKKESESKKTTESSKPSGVKTSESSGGKPPVVTSGKPPAVTSGKPPAVMSGKPPAVTSGKPPAVTSGKPHAVTSAKPPAVSSAKPPAVSSAKRPAITSGKRPAVTSGKWSAETSGKRPAEAMGGGPAKRGRGSTNPVRPPDNSRGRGGSSSFKGGPSRGRGGRGGAPAMARACGRTLLPDPDNPKRGGDGLLPIPGPPPPPEPAMGMGDGMWPRPPFLPPPPLPPSMQPPMHPPSMHPPSMHPSSMQPPSLLSVPVNPTPKGVMEGEMLGPPELEYHTMELNEIRHELENRVLETRAELETHLSKLDQAYLAGLPPKPQRPMDYLQEEGRARDSSRRAVLEGRPRADRPEWREDSGEYRLPPRPVPPPPGLPPPPPQSAMMDRGYDASSSYNRPRLEEKYADVGPSRPRPYLLEAPPEQVDCGETVEVYDYEHARRRTRIESDRYGDDRMPPPSRPAAVDRDRREYGEERNYASRDRYGYEEADSRRAPSYQPYEEDSRRGPAPRYNDDYDRRY
ncbi:hypothetical protein ACOMHN_054275 [Nucella lapillus]